MRLPPTDEAGEVVMENGKPKRCAEEEPNHQNKSCADSDTEIRGEDVLAVLYPMFVNMSQEATDQKDGQPAAAMSINWKEEHDGWHLYRAVPDSGAQVSCGPAEMAQGYAIKETAASKAGKGFTSASKHSIPNIGALEVPMCSPEGLWTMQQWQCTPEGTMARPLLSIGQECDSDNYVIFSRRGGAIVNEHTGQMRRFPRLQNGAYEIEMWLPPIKMIEEARTKLAESGNTAFPRQGA